MASSSGGTIGPSTQPFSSPAEQGSSSSALWFSNDPLESWRRTTNENASSPPPPHHHQDVPAVKNDETSSKQQRTDRKKKKRRTHGSQTCSELLAPLVPEAEGISPMAQRIALIGNAHLSIVVMPKRTTTTMARIETETPHHRLVNCWVATLLQPFCGVIERHHDPQFTVPVGRSRCFRIVPRETGPTTSSRSRVASRTTTNESPNGPQSPSSMFSLLQYHHHALLLTVESGRFLTESRSDVPRLNIPLIHALSKNGPSPEVTEDLLDKALDDASPEQRALKQDIQLPSSRTTTTTASSSHVSSSPNVAPLTSTRERVWNLFRALISHLPKSFWLGNEEEEELKEGEERGTERVGDFSAAATTTTKKSTRTPPPDYVLLPTGMWSTMERDLAEVRSAVLVPTTATTTHPSDTGQVEAETVDDHLNPSTLTGNGFPPSLTHLGVSSPSNYSRPCLGPKGVPLMWVGFTTRTTNPEQGETGGRNNNATKESDDAALIEISTLLYDQLFDYGNSGSNKAGGTLSTRKPQQQQQQPTAFLPCYRITREELEGMRLLFVGRVSGFCREEDFVE